MSAVRMLPQSLCFFLVTAIISGYAPTPADPFGPTTASISSDGYKRMPVFQIRWASSDLSVLRGGVPTALVTASPTPTPVGSCPLPDPGNGAVYDDGPTKVSRVPIGSLIGITIGAAAGIVILVVVLSRLYQPRERKSRQRKVELEAGSVAQVPRVSDAETAQAGVTSDVMARTTPVQTSGGGANEVDGNGD
ncbi:hypothetical protein B0H63DRAFT_219946 [Podospora didyma]|uniref:Mid2 domain-containing protein n=1 Tax=Podospora didyma TaxID=330526 RepID=A0AAE0NCD9_9PEZI|nr:hypothetical protein B0H63DRAFT_219946 [Podospora didyma]